MSRLIIWHNRFSENENEAVGAHIPRHQDLKTKKPRRRDSKTKNRDIEIRGLKHHDMEKWKQLSHDIVILRHFFRGQKAMTSRSQD